VYRRYKAKNYNIGTKPQTGRRPGVKIQAYCRVCLAACCSRNARSYMTWGKGARKAEGAPSAEKREARSFLVDRLGRKKVDHHSLRRSGDYGRATKVPSGKWFPRCNKESPGQIQTTDAAAAPPSISYNSDGTRSVGYSSTRWPLGWWLFCLSVYVWAWVAVGVWIGSG
jgi:hypothetical protein